jgi:uncharacterized protein YndB with AHSA1/START domain
MTSLDDSSDEAARGEDAGSHVVHGSFELELALPAPRSLVFAAFAEPQLRRRWFRIPSDTGDGLHELDFRLGGSEVAFATLAPAGTAERLAYRSLFLDIVPDERIVFTYELVVDGRRRSVSLVTVEFAPDDGGTRLTRTEQYALLAVEGDGRNEVAHLEGGTRLQLNGLVALVGRLTRSSADEAR